MTDLVFTNARVVDGTGAAAYTADVAVTGDRITEVGQGLAGHRSIDADGARAYVMGERGARQRANVAGLDEGERRNRARVARAGGAAIQHEPATPEDIAAMKAIVKEGLAAGTLGFSTSRTLAHRAIDGEPVPGTFAAEDELFGIGEALRELGTGVYEIAPAGAAGEDVNAPPKEVEWTRRPSPMELLYDLLLEDEGRNLPLMPLLNHAALNLDPVREMLTHPRAVLGLGDGGAHCGFICDASLPTTMLSHWARDRRRGERLPLEQGVRLMTRDTAQLYGLGDRGVIAPGMKADLNLIDFDRVANRRPEMVHDLPAGGRRLVQRADGYLATFVSGKQTFADGEHTGELPGRLVRGAR